MGGGRSERGWGVVWWELVDAQVSGASRASILALGAGCSGLCSPKVHSLFSRILGGGGDFLHSLGLLVTPGFDEDCKFQRILTFL